MFILMFTMKGQLAMSKLVNRKSRFHGFERVSKVLSRAKTLVMSLNAHRGEASKRKIKN